MSDQFKVKWIDRGRPPQVAPNPAFPNGIDIDAGERPACRLELPYMTEKNVGYFSVLCEKCGATALITMASRSDDPKSIMLPCK
jgi:hypothetical protein